MFDFNQIEEEYFFQLDNPLVTEIVNHYKHTNTALLLNYINGEKNASRH